MAVLSNLGSFNPVEAANKVAAVYLKPSLTPEPPAVTRTFIKVNPAVLKTFAGTYSLPQIGQTLVAVVEGDKLLAAGPVQPPLEMKAVSSSSFYVEPLAATLDFTPAPNGGMKVKITQPGVVLEGVRIVYPPKAVTDLQPYVGTYWNNELETQYTF